MLHRNSSKLLNTLLTMSVRFSFLFSFFLLFFFVLIDVNGNVDSLNVERESGTFITCLGRPCTVCGSKN